MNALAFKISAFYDISLFLWFRAIFTQVKKIVPKRGTGFFILLTSNKGLKSAFCPFHIVTLLERVEYAFHPSSIFRIYKNAAAA